MQWIGLLVEESNYIKVLCEQVYRKDVKQTPKWFSFSLWWVQGYAEVSGKTPVSSLNKGTHEIHADSSARH